MDRTAPKQSVVFLAIKSRSSADIPTVRKMRFVVVWGPVARNHGFLFGLPSRDK